MTGLVHRRLFWPTALLVALLALNIIAEPGFASVRLQDGHLFGSIIDVLRNGSPTLLVALGMTLVIATRGIDLSVGAVVAISGSIACTIIAGSPDPGSIGVVAVAILTAVAVALVLGGVNGTLVSIVGVQPIVATLILMTAGRGIAMLITEGQIISVSSPAYQVIGGGFFLLLPVSVLIAAVIFAGTALLTRKTALGMLIESVGINPEASRLAGVRSRSIMMTVYVFSAVCAAVAGLMISSNVTAADANNAGLFIELDAILAVVIGGTSLAGGRFSLIGTLLGALVIQMLTTTVYSVGIAPELTLIFKALVVVAVCLLQSPALSRRLARPRRLTPLTKEVVS
ncbi:MULTISPECIES: ABC transporter permease [unclassified Frigoribacterium]|uniref:ABC transporter permease n=1 Tax=unclassified Frigoribacterium TaxID=2627005 RepID=UPI000AB8ECEF|nr:MULTISPECIES: ABC transporter permease [unclassified Frigoribacterium]